MNATGFGHVRLCGSLGWPSSDGDREGREGQDVRRGIRQQFGHLGKELPEASVQLAVDLGGRQLLVDGADHGGHTELGHSGEQVG